MTRMQKVGLGTVAAIVAIQLVPVSRSNPPVTGSVRAPEEVEAVLRRSCFDCHSNETVWPWYARVAPVSWLVARDVKEGREELNFSEWAGYAAEDRNETLEDIEEVIDELEMPLPIYIRMHAEARLTDAERALLIGWAREEREGSADDFE